MPHSDADLAERLGRLRAPALGVGALAAATLALHLRDPHQQHSWGICPSWGLFGIYCPLCGGLRATNDLTNLDLVGAFHGNPLYVVMIPVAVFYLGRWLLDAWRGRPARAPFFLTAPPALACSVAVLVVFTVVRNTPWGAWMHP